MTRTRLAVLSALGLAASLAVPAGAAQPATGLPAEALATASSGGVAVTVTADSVTLSTPLVERTWSRSALRTTALVDKRGQDVTWSSGSRDFALTVGGQQVGSEQFRVTGVDTRRLDGGLRLVLRLAAPGLTATREVEAYAGIAGFRSRTTVTSTAGLVLSGWVLDEVAAGPSAVPTLHALRAGADWREPGWTGPEYGSVGDPHAGTWRDTRTAPAGQALSGPGQWLSLSRGGRSAFLVAERADQPSSVGGYDGTTGRVGADLSRDVIGLGPFEESAHVENPTPAQGRQRVVRPGQPLALDWVFTGFGVDADDEPAQHALALQRRHRQTPLVTFNSNGTDTNKISTGAKDDMDYATVLEVAPRARALGTDVFILDDGWQAISGDWFPDSAEHPEPRWDGTATSKFRPRFPDTTFRAVREAIAPMKLGLWMSPMHFNPASATYRAHPEWACAPVGHGLAVANTVDPNTGSNDAGIGAWGPAAIPHVENRIRSLITGSGVVYFKFDFLAWLDCPDQGTTKEDMQDAFVAMLDRLRADHPDVEIQIDETNDYRLFPYQSVGRGPAWFQNGSPAPEHLLHNLWNLAPYVPSGYVGQHVLGARQYEKYPVDTLMAGALTGHVTFFSELRGIPDAVLAAARPWADLRHRYADLLVTPLTYPLLADPVEKGWTALQPWDPEGDRGALLVFRQDAPTATQRVGLRAVEPAHTYDVVDARTGELVRTATGAELRAGLDVTLDQVRTARVLLVVPAGSAP